MKGSRKWMALAGAGLAVVILVVLALPVAAAGGKAASVYHGRGWTGGGAGGEYLAEALGITVAELDAARDQARLAGIDQALDLGLITEAQAEALRTGSGRALQGWVLRNSTIDPEALLADALGIGADDLRAARETAHAAVLADAVAEGRITQEQADEMLARQALRGYLDEQGLQESMRALVEDAIQQAVAAGVITQEQADAILSREGFFGGLRGLGGWDGFHGHGGMRGRGGMHGPGGMHGFSAPDGAAPSGLFSRPAGRGFGSVSL